MELHGEKSLLTTGEGLRIIAVVVLSMPAILIVTAFITVGFVYNYDRLMLSKLLLPVLFIASVITTLWRFRTLRRSYQAATVAVLVVHAIAIGALAYWFL